MPRYLVFDNETTIKQSYKRKANCFDPENWIVARGWKYQGDAQCSWTYHKEYDRTSYLSIAPDCTLIVGFNLKFDLLWEMAQGNPDLLPFFQRGGKIWDCQYVEYLLEGQTKASQMCALTDTAPKYGGTKKIDEVKLLWDAGVNTNEIDEDLLIDYLVGTEEEQRNGGDIGNTERIFLGQIKKARAQKQTLMIQDRMDGLLATTYMEYAGVKVDVKEAGRRLKILKADLAKKEAELDTFIPNDLPFEFNWASGIQTSCLIFGGTVKYSVQDTYIDEATGELARLKATERWPMFAGQPREVAKYPATFKENADGVWYAIRKDGSLLYQDMFLSGAKKGAGKFKSVPVQGELKVKYQDRLFKFPGYTTPDPSWKGAQTDGAGGPIYSTGSDTMEVLFTRDIPFLKALSAKKALDKEIGTYYVKVDDKGKTSGMLTCVQTTDHILHPKLNHVNTVTTRLSSSDPNMQNIPRNDLNDEGLQKSEVKAMFVSRFGADGVMIEADYSQLEVVVQGVLSGDTALCNDLNNKIDFHCKRVAAKIGSMTYEEALEWCKNEDHPDYRAGKKERTKCKIFSFQRAYGAGAYTIALETGMSVEEVQDLMVAEDIMYPGVVQFNQAVEQAVMSSAVPFQALNEETGQWQNYRTGDWFAPTGTRYRFRTWNAPAFLRKRGVLDSFSPPELKNYPVQGTGGEFVQAVLGLLWRHFVSKNFYGNLAFLVNTVHDCVWIDCHKSVLDEVCRDVKRIMQSIPDFYNGRHGMAISVPFPVEVEVGPNMNKLKHWHPGEPAWHHKEAA